MHAHSVWTDLPTARHFHSMDRSGDLNGAHAAIFTALLPDILQDLFIVIIIKQLLRQYHVKEAQHCSGHGRVLQPLQPRHLQAHWTFCDHSLKTLTKISLTHGKSTHCRIYMFCLLTWMYISSRGIERKTIQNLNVIIKACSGIWNLFPLLVISQYFQHWLTN